MGRAPCCDKANVKRGPWSPEEDTKLKTYVEKHGTGGNWIVLPHKAGLKRCGKSCRLRWLNYLRPDIKHGGFTEEEDNVICHLYRNMGSRWSLIASRLPGRTDNDVKNHWNTKLKKKIVGGKTSINLTARNQIHQNPPSPSPITIQTLNSETCSQTIPSMDAQRTAYQPAMLPMLELIKPSDFTGSANCYIVSPPGEISASSSSSSSSSLVKLENNGSCISWSDYIGNGDDDFFMDFAIGSSSDPFCGYEIENKMGDVAQNCAPNLASQANFWANAEQNFTYS